MIVPRFSALALVCVALIALTGTYAAWIETGDLMAFDEPYLRILAIKAAIALVAFGVGALNYVSDPAGVRFGGLARRVGVEGGLAVVVVVATAALTNGAPPSGDRPIALAETTTAAAGSGSVSLAIAPGRAGPNRFVVALAGDAAAAARTPGASVALSLERLDAPAASVVQPLAASGGAWAGDVAGLTSGSRWAATVVVRDAAGVEALRRPFGFALGPAGLTEGRASPPIDPSIVAALVLLALGVLATVFALAGGRAPHVDPRLGRLALLVGGPLGAALGVAMLVAGPRP